MIKQLIGMGLFAFLILKLVTHGLDPEDFYSPRYALALIGSLAALSVYFYYQYQISIGFSVAHLAPPIGILVSLLSITPSQAMEPIEVSLSLAPAIVGCAFGAMFIRSVGKAVLLPRWPGWLDFVGFFFAICFIYFVATKHPSHFFYNGETGGFPGAAASMYAGSAAIGFYCFAGDDKPFAVKAAQAALNGFLLMTAINVLAYYAIVVPSIDTRGITIALGMVSILAVNSATSLMLYLFSRMVCLATGQTAHLMRDNYFLVAGLLGFIALVVAPFSAYS
jgi:hypothetical protein